jgi:hypothetical protein
MYQGLLHAHNLLRWVILILLLVNILRHITALNKPFASGDRKLGLFLMISAHITLLIGLYQWFAGPWGYELISNNGFGVVMKDSVYRFWAVEHPLGMLISIILITIGKGQARKLIPDDKKHKKSLLFFFIALLVILVTVPWPFREGIARPWIPGMPL